MAWKTTHPSVSGREGNYAMCEIVNAIRYQGRTGVQWDFLPHDLLPKSATYYYFTKWRDDGTDQVICDLLRRYLQESKGRKADPSPAVLDTQSVHAAAGVPAATTGKDVAKRSRGANAAWPQARSSWYRGGGAGRLRAREHRGNGPAGPGRH
ncbi:transposase [Planomonospora sphaerica]|uniref:Transposase n=1 Tax=Planomonospora sphaerica TaxID=161355 RepID=A0A161MDV0_9ACTN|nr:transposase [Planomonospora sphaerica]GAT69923.1 transposase [Planomonospora sphaerica]